MSAIYHLSNGRAGLQPGRSVNPTIPIRALLLQIHLEFALRPRELPRLVTLADRGHRIEAALFGNFEERVPERHPAEVRDVAHAAVQITQAKELDRAQDHHQILELDRENIKNNDTIRPQNRCHQQNAEDRSRRANGRNPRVTKQVIGQDYNEPRPDAAKEIELQESPRAPDVLQVLPEKPQEQHVHEDVHEPAVQK